MSTFPTLFVRTDNHTWITNTGLDQDRKHLSDMAVAFLIFFGLLRMVICDGASPDSRLQYLGLTPAPNICGLKLLNQLPENVIVVAQKSLRSL